MLIFHKIEDLQAFLNQNKKAIVGFIPTMGTLHDGHLSLIKKAKETCDLTICSIFINPIQFNKQEDLDNYPKNFEKDVVLLQSIKCDVLFNPSAEEMYPSKIEKEYDFGNLSTVMEGKHRPGHFNGVAIVIERFFQIINPDFAYFGEKDFQQLAIVKALTKMLGIKTKIIGGEIIREPSGLAMSSRNERLSIEEKEAAALINKVLKYISTHKNNYSIDELLDYYIKTINANLLLKTEYIEIVDSETLQPIKNWNESNAPIAFTAVNVGNIRLIDNMTIIN
jgi:pantoate--beta-alanine ligase